MLSIRWTLRLGTERAGNLCFVYLFIFTANIISHAFLLINFSKSRWNACTSFWQKHMLNNMGSILCVVLRGLCYFVTLRASSETDKPVNNNNNNNIIRTSPIDMAFWSQSAKSLNWKWWHQKIPVVRNESKPHGAGSGKRVERLTKDVVSESLQGTFLAIFIG